jgi:4'-phosphopantetheinyl transferase
MRGLSRIAAPAPFELWLAELHDAPGDAQLRSLSAAERERAARFVFERDRRRYLAAHCALRHVLATRTGTPAADLQFVEGAFGKPALIGERRCAFNLSHSDDVALIALAGHDDGDEIGVDLEMLRPMPDAQALARQNFSTAENAELTATRPEDRSLAFLLGWTRKEACLKAIGSGLSIAPNIFTAGLDTAPRSVGIDTPDGIARVWVQSLRPRPDIVASVARIDAGRTPA